MNNRLNNADKQKQLAALFHLEEALKVVAELMPEQREKLYGPIYVAHFSISSMFGDCKSEQQA